MKKKKYKVMCFNKHYITFIVEATNKKSAEEQVLCGEYLEIIEDQFWNPDEFDVEKIEIMEEK